MTSVVDAFLADAAQTYYEKPTIQQLRTRLEWAWGLEYNGLEEHFALFPDIEQILGVRDALYIPLYKDSALLNQRNLYLEFDMPRPHIMEVYGDATSFRYFVLPLRPNDPPASRVIESTVPTHIITVDIAAKLSRAGANTTSLCTDPVCSEIVQRAAAARPDRSFDFRKYHISDIRLLTETWILAEYPPPTFTGELEATLIVGDEHGSPKRAIVLSTDSDDDYFASPEQAADESLLEAGESDCDSEFEDDTDDLWMVGVQDWTVATAEVAERDEDVLINTISDQDDATETPRTFTSVELEKPDYLRHPRALVVGS
ncbi:PCI domain-containing protein [Mycena kentingensis (nom. inval.)]|nr:PCI domain-containing protein [Mycena kentingensis (nom. inval.)]